MVELNKDLIEHVAELYGPERDAESDEEDVPKDQVKLDEALKALETLRLYEEQQEDGEDRLINLLSRHERRIRA